MELWVDGPLVFRGGLRQAPACKGSDFAQSILFTADGEVVRAEKSRVCYCGQEEQDVLYINEQDVMIESKAMHRKPDPRAEGITADLTARPTTSVPHRHR